VFYAINTGEGNDVVKRFQDRTKLDFGVVILDQSGVVAKSYGLSGLPQSYIIDKLGRVRAIYRGFSSDLEDRFTRDLADILDGRDVSNDERPETTNENQVSKGTIVRLRGE
jgi:hypothetical protein